MKKKKTNMNQMVGDVPGYLVFLITYLCALLGVTFLGGSFLLMRQLVSDVSYACDASVKENDSNMTKWLAWAIMVFRSSISNTDVILNKFSKFLRYIPEWLIFYGFSIVLMMVIPVIIFPLSIALVVYTSFQKCEEFPDSIHYALPPAFFYELCDRKNEVWDYNNLGMTILFKTIPWIFHMVFHLMQSFFFLAMNMGVWNLAATLSSLIILWSIFVTPFFKTEEIFKVMGTYTMSLSFLILSIVLYGAFKFLSVYVFLGFCIAAVVIVSRETIAELLKPNK
jgi:hypothetical protein